MPVNQILDKRNKDIKIYINGSFFDRDDAKISVFDSGFLLGDGIWASHWYSSVKNSTCFKSEKNKNIILTDNEKRIVDMAMPIYEELYSKAI